MRIPSGVVDQYIYFVGVDATDLKTRETGLSSFTVYRSRNGAAAAAMTTPTVNETDSTNMPGVYELLLDEDMTIGSGNDSEEMVFHITATGMAPVTRTIELYRSKITAGNTLDVTSTGAAGIDWGNIENKTTANDLSGTDIQLVDTCTTNTDMVSAAPTAAAVADAVLDEALSGHTTAGTLGKAVTDIEADTNELQSDDVPGLIAALNDFDPALDTVATVTNVTNQVTADVTAISGDTVAADNLESTYDGTGYVDDNAPATQSQISGIANVGSAVHRPSSSYTLTSGTQSANTYTSTEALDGVRHEHTDAAGIMELYYEFNIGSGTPSSVQVTGYLTGSNDDLGVYGYDWVSAGWKQIGNIQGSSSTNNSVYSLDLFVDMVGSGADEGKVRVRFYKASGLTSATLAVDQIFVAFSQGTEGYDNGSVWFDSNASNTNTVVNIDGTARNPVSSSAALLTLLANTNLNKIEVVPGSTLTLGASYEGYSVKGNGSQLALGSQDIGGTVFEDFSSITGTGTTTGNQAFFRSCVFGTATLPPSIRHFCGYGGTITMGSAGDFTDVDGYSTVAGSGSPTFTKTAGQAITAEWRRWSGGSTCSGIEAGDVYTIGGEMGTITLNGADGTVEVRGAFKGVTDNRTGSPTLNLDGAIQSGDVADILVDTGTDIPARFDGVEGATFNTSTDSLEAIRDRGDAAWTTGAGGTPPQLLQNTTIATLASQTSFTLTAGSSDNDAYNGAIAIVTDSVTSEQKAVGNVSDYVGSTKTVTLDADPGIFTMAVGDTIDIIASVGNAPSAASVADAVWDEALSGHTTAGSAGKSLADVETDATAILADTNELQTNQGNWLTVTGHATEAKQDIIDTNVDAILVDTGTTLPATLTTIEGKIDTVDTNVDAILVDTGTTLPASLTTIDTNVDAILVDTGTTLPATLSTIEGKVDTVDLNVDAILVDTGTTLPASIATVDSNVDAIKAKTDSLTYTVAGQVDANIQYVNDTQVTGDGGSGTEWGPV